MVFAGRLLRAGEPAVAVAAKCLYPPTGQKPRLAPPWLQISTLFEFLITHTHTHTHTHRAVTASTRAQQLAQMLVESELLARLQHRTVLQFYGVVSEGPDTILVTIILL